MALKTSPLYISSWCRHWWVCWGTRQLWYQCRLCQHWWEFPVHLLGGVWGRWQDLQRFAAFPHLLSVLTSSCLRCGRVFRGCGWVQFKQWVSEHRRSLWMLLSLWIWRGWIHMYRWAEALVWLYILMQNNRVDVRLIYVSIAPFLDTEYIHHESGQL